MQRQLTRPAVIMGLMPTGLAPLRRLGAMGVPCLGIWRGRTEIGRHSKYLLRSIQVPNLASHDQLLGALDELTAPWRDSSPILFAASDRFAAFIDEMQDELRPRYTFRCSRRKLHTAFVDKGTTIEICSAAGVPIPRSIAIQTVQDLSSVGGDFQFPVIVKPRRTYGIDFPAKNAVASSAAELMKFFEERPHLLGQTVAQEVVPSGDGRIVMAISYSGRDGKVLVRATCRKLRQWPPDYGMTSLGRSEFLPEVAALTERFLNGIGYEGFAGVEFAEDARSGRYFLLEVNPRLNLPIQLALDAKVDLIGSAYREMTLGDPAVAAPLRQIDGLYWIYLHHDVLSFLHKYRRGRITVSDWIRSIARASSHATFDLRDPKPWLASSLELARELVDMLARYLGARLRSGVLRLRSRMSNEA